MINTWKDGVKEKDDHGETPLHLACQCDQSYKVLKLLIRVYPDAMEQHDNGRCTPLQECRNDHTRENFQCAVDEHRTLALAESRMKVIKSIILQGGCIQEQTKMDPNSVKQHKHLKKKRKKLHN